MNSLPIACDLTSVELRERRRTVLETLRSAVLVVEELADGFACSFMSEGNRFKELANMIDLERQCCPFLQFRVTVAAGHGPLTVEITGPEGTKEFLLSAFEWEKSAPEACEP
jgi:nucleotidyltransferase/DNA polymerase involved in DNA repair